MSYGAGGGFDGKGTHLTVFSDGRVEGSDSGPTTPPVRVTVARVEKLAADLAATGVFEEKDGTWAPREPVPDGGGATIVVRDKAGAVHAYAWATGAKAPAAVERAMQVAGVLASEIERDHPKAPCACQPTDPRCACP